MNVPENNEESCVGTGAHGHFFDDGRGCSTTPDPAPVPQDPSFTLQGDRTYTKLLQEYTNYPSDCYHLPPNAGGYSDNPQLFYAVTSPTNTTTEFPNVEDSTLIHLGCHQDHPEALASGIPSGSPYLETLLFLSASDLQSPASLHRVIEPYHLCSSQTLPKTPCAEMNFASDTSRILVPPPDVHPFSPSRPISWTGYHSSEFGDYKALPPTMAMRGRTRDNLKATTSLGSMSMHLPSPSQAPGLHTYSSFHLSNPTSNDDCPLGPYTHEVVPSDFQLERQGRQLATTVAFTPPPNRVSARRKSKKYWCHSCDTGFSQKQGFNRHNKDKHSNRNPCPYCSDFESSPGRKYLFKKHLETKHPGDAPPPRF